MIGRSENGKSNSNRSLPLTSAPRNIGATPSERESQGGRLPSVDDEIGDGDTFDAIVASGRRRDRRLSPAG